jgi:hypothetical protein
VLVVMEPRLKGFFEFSDYDLLLTFDGEHLVKNQAVLDKLHHGFKIKFTGFLHSIGTKVEPSMYKSQQIY